MKVVVTGSLAYDFIANFPGKFGDHILPEKIHQINLSFLVDDLRQERGGCAGNMAYTLSLLGEKPLIAGVLGKDGKEYRRWLKSKGIDVGQIYMSKKLTARALVMTDSDDNQITSFYPGDTVDEKITLKRLKFKPELVVIAPNPASLMMKLVNECQELGFDYFYDPGMQLPRLMTEELVKGIEGAKIVIGNDYETTLINLKLKITNLKLKKEKIWITTLGSQGSVIEYRGEKIKIPPAKPKNNCDPTGAGDAYRAGFIWAYLKGWSLAKAGRCGSLAAAYTVEKYGTTTHRFTIKEFKERYRENFGENL